MEMAMLIDSAVPPAHPECRFTATTVEPECPRPLGGLMAELRSNASRHIRSTLAAIC